jgi:hypothetical protein
MTFKETMGQPPKAAGESQEDQTEKISNQAKERDKTDVPEANWIPSKFSPDTKIDWSPKQIFQNALNDEIEIAKIRGEITPERAQEIYEAGSQIETGFSQDPKYDAKLFCNNNPASQENLIKMFKWRTENPDRKE